MRKMYPLKRITYYTMNSWNRCTAPAYNLKIHTVIADKAIRDKLYDMVGLEDFYYPINEIIDNFEAETGWRAGFNGRSGGYLVLYHSDNMGTVDVKEVPSEVLKAFRKLALDIVREAIWMAEHNHIEQEEYTVTKTRNILVENA